jgi:hypothetical protein
MITATLNGVAMPMIQRDFINTNLENAADVVTLDNSMYTDFVDNTHGLWEFNYAVLSQAEYDALRAAYDEQFLTGQYPLLSIPYYSVLDRPVRMYMNEKNIWNNCGSVQGLQIEFRETAQLPPEES